MLVLTEERGRDADTVNVGGNGFLGLDQVEQGGDPIFKAGAEAGDAAGLYLAGPLDDQRYADAAFVERAFQATQRFYALKEIVVYLQLQVRGAVVRGEHNDGGFFEAEILHEIQNIADVTVHAGDHRSVRGARREVRRVAVALIAGEGRVIPFLREVRL